MSQSNKNTLHTYDQNVQKYVEGTVQKTDGEQQVWLDSLLADLPTDAAILEIGSAFGRDADYIDTQGYRVQRTDGSTGFVDLLRTKGFEAKLLDIVETAPEAQYDLILACAVFLHFDQEDFGRALINVQSALKTEGRFAFSLKHGEGEEWSDQKMDAPRFFKYWRQDAVNQELARAGLKSIRSELLADNKWLHVVTEKL